MKTITALSLASFAALTVLLLVKDPGVTIGVGSDAVSASDSAERGKPMAGEGMADPLVARVQRNREESGVRSGLAESRNRTLSLVLPPGLEEVDLLACEYRPDALELPGSGSERARVLDIGHDSARRILEQAEGSGALVFGAGVEPRKVLPIDFQGEEVVLEPLAATRVTLSGAADGEARIVIEGNHGATGAEGAGVPWGLAHSFEGDAWSLPTVPGWASVRVVAGIRMACWSGKLPVASNAIVLELQAPIRASGRVVGMPGRQQGARVLVRAAGTHRSATLVESAVAADGAWGVNGVPWVEGGSYTLRLEHPMTVPVEVEATAVSPGAALNADLEWTPGDRQAIKTVDLDEKPVAGAKVAMQWSVDGVWRRAEVIADGEGLASFPSAPQGVVYLRAYKPGFARDAYGPYSLPLRGSEPIVLKLQPVGGIALTLSGPSPRGDEVVIRYRPADGLALETRMKYRPGGEHVMEGVKVGLTQVAVQSATSSSVQMKTVNVIAGELVPLTLELKDHVPVRGRVLSALSGEPMQGASVTAWHHPGMPPPHARLREPVITGTDGQFQGLLMAPAGGFVLVQAEGASPTKTFVDGPLTEGEALPPILLDPLQEYRLTLTGAADGFEGYRLTRAGVFGVKDFFFDAGGRLTIDDCPPGQPARFVVHDPEGGFYQVESILVIGEGWDESLAVDTGRVVTVDLTELQDEHGSGWYHLRTEYQDTDGKSVSHTQTAEPGMTSYPLGDIPLVNCLVTVARGKQWVASGVFDLTRPGDHQISVPAAPEPIGFQIRAPTGEAVRDVTGDFVQAAEGAFSWSAFSDAEGSVEVQFAVPGPGVFFSKRFAPSSFFRAPVTLGEPFEPWPEVAFELPCRAEVSLTPSHGEPRAILVDTGFAEHWQVREVMTSDENGDLPMFRASEGRYRIQVTQPGFWREVLEFTLKPGGNTIHRDVRLAGGLRVVTGGPSGANRDIVVWSLADQVRATEWKERVASAGAHLTGTDGVLELPMLPVGPYEVWFYGERSSSSKFVTVQPGALAAVELGP